MPTDEYSDEGELPVDEQINVNMTKGLIILKNKIEQAEANYFKTFDKKYRGESNKLKEEVIMFMLERLYKEYPLFCKIDQDLNTLENMSKDSPLFQNILQELYPLIMKLYLEFDEDINYCFSHEGMSTIEFSLYKTIIRRYNTLNRINNYDNKNSK